MNPPTRTPKMAEIGERMDMRRACIFSVPRFRCGFGFFPCFSAGTASSSYRCLRLGAPFALAPLMHSNRRCAFQSPGLRRNFELPARSGVQMPWRKPKLRSKLGIDARRCAFKHRLARFRPVGNARPGPP